MIYIIHPKDKEQVLARKNLPWTALACSQEIQGLRADLYKSTAKDIEDIAGKQRQYFVDYIGRMAEKQEDLVLWYSGRFASKSMSQTTIFHQYIYLKLIQAYAQEYGDQLILTDNAELLYNLEKAKLSNVSLLSASSGKIIPRKIRLKKYLKICKYIVYWCIFRFIKKKDIAYYNCFIHSWLNDRCFQDMPNFYDSYLGHLGQYLGQKGIKWLA